MLTCPNDGVELKTIQIESLSVQQCPTCHGYWLERGILESLGEHHHMHLEPITVVNVGVITSTRKCPQDATKMRVHEFAEHSGIKIDQCSTCQGIWLDDAELGGIIDYLNFEAEHPDLEPPAARTTPTLSERIVLFLYQLTLHPPII